MTMSQQVQRRSEAAALAPGYNHDIPYRGIVYHVQTEFLRQPSPHVETQIYCQGRIVEAETTMLDEPRNGSSAELNSVMTSQHRAMIRRLVSGQVRDDDATIGPPISLVPGSSSSDAAGELTSLRRPADARRHLELRRSAIRVARAVRREQPPPPELVRTRLGAIVSSMADVAIRHPYQQTRHEELALLLMLRSEAMDWLRDREASTEQGLRLWRGFAQASEALFAVNGRREVIAHDREIWDLARKKLAAAGEDEAVDRDLLRDLRATWGRYKALDELLDFCSSPRAGALLGAIESALQSLEEDSARRRGERSSPRPPRPVD